MSFLKKSASAFGKLIIVIALAGTFIVGMVGVVYMSLQGLEMKVPEITGKDFLESEKELAAMGLRIKKRADRNSTEKPNTILEQLPKAGGTVKTGQMILVVTSNYEGGDAPAPIKKNVDELNDSEKIEELISDKPKKTNKANANVNPGKKKSSTTRDVISNNSNSNSNSADDKGSTDKNSNSGDKSNKNAATNSNKSNSNVSKPNTNANKTAAPKPPVSGGDVRPRRTPQP